MFDNRPTPKAAQPAVRAVVTRQPQPPEGDAADTELLLVYDRHHEAWTPPIDRVEPGESITACVRREVREETGVRVPVDALVAVYSNPVTRVYGHRSGEVVQMVTTVVRCTPAADSSTLSPDPETDAEVADAAFRPGETVAGVEPFDPWVRDAFDGGDAVLR